MVTFNEASALAKDRGLNFREAQELLALQEARSGRNKPTPVQPAVDPAIAYGLGYDPTTAPVQQTELPPLPPRLSTGGSSGGSKSASAQAKQTGGKGTARQDASVRPASNAPVPVRKPADVSAGVAAVPGKSYGPGSQTGVVNPAVAPGQAGASGGQSTDDSHWRNVALAILTGLGVATGAHLLGRGGSPRGSRPRPTSGTGTAVDTGGLVGQVLPPQRAIAPPQPRAQFTPPTQITNQQRVITDQPNVHGPEDRFSGVDPDLEDIIRQQGTTGVPVGQPYSPSPSGPINQGMSPQPAQLSAPVNHNMPQDIYARGLPQTQGLTFDQLLAVLGGYAQHQGIGPSRPNMPFNPASSELNAVMNQSNR